MLLVADENIPLLDNFFGDMATIRRLPGRCISSADVADADGLLVRSVTRVDSELLSGSAVRFVGTATIGTDHVDLPWLAKQGIAFVNAPGCNANAVVEYVLSCLSLYLERRQQSWADISVGIVGCGNVGSRLRQRLSRMGTRVLVNDPPLAEAGEENLVSLDEVLACDVVSLHTPLERAGEYPTHHLLGSAELAAMGPGRLLINSGRGEVVDNAALKASLRDGTGPITVLDVWENEPSIDPALVDLVWLATPHIAGYSLEGKVIGTERIYRGLCQFLDMAPMKRAEQYLPDPALRKLGFCSAADPDEVYHTAIRACYDVRRDDIRLRDAVAACEAPDLGAGFDQLRRNYRVRREFSSLRVELKGACKTLQQGLLALGFKVKL